MIIPKVRTSLTMTVSVMVTTKSRATDLKRTCRILRQLDPSPLELLITADGCTDGTVEFVRSALPEAKLIVNDPPVGSVASRDRMMREARVIWSWPSMTTVIRSS